MASNEIDSFVKKYKVLCQAGRTASLNFSSNAGKVSVILRVELGVLEEGPKLPPNPSRNGPARQRRRERRAAERVAKAEEAEAALSVEEQEVLEMAVKAIKEVNVPEKGLTDVESETVQDVSAKATKAFELEVVDEVCNDSEFELKANDEPDAKPCAVDIPTKPPPIRDRSLGGIDYYTATYDDPTDEEEFDDIY